jgi:hypothetical protein
MKSKSPTRRSERQGPSKAAKALQRAIDKSDRKEPPTVGKPVIDDPTPESKETDHD